MAVRSSVASRLHLLSRILGLTGLLAIFVALVLWSVMPGEGWDLHGLHLPGAELPWILGFAALGAVILALLFEMRGVAWLFSSRKAALGSNVLVQIILATVLVLGANTFSFFHYQRFDWTADQRFTLPEDIRADLAKLRGQTDIVVFHQYQAFGQRGDVKQDKYDIAAAKKIVEKVRDLADLFQDLGPRFRVRVLDIQDDDYQEKLRRIEDEAPQLAEAIRSAPENSVFFYTDEPRKLQRLGFSDIYQLDKVASQERENLVLNDQGVRPFARKVFNIEEKKPRIGVAVVHELLSLKTADPFYGMPGLKKALEARGYDYRDVILKTKWGQGPRPEAAVLTHDENRFERLEAQATNFERIINNLEEENREIALDQKFWKTTPLPDLNKKYAVVRTFQGLALVEWEQLERVRKERGSLPPHRKLTEEDRASRLEVLQEVAKENEEALQSLTKKLTKVSGEKERLNVENLEEQRRIADLRAKFNRMLADVDLLVVPRHTIYDVVREEAIPAGVHTLDDTQIEAIKDFMKAGKPVLFALGPSNERSEFAEPAQDRVVELLQDLGVELPKQTILFNVEGDALADRGERVLMGGGVEVPSVRFDWPAGAAIKHLNLRTPETATPHPIRTSLHLTARAFGKDQPIELQVRSPRPVYYLTSAWNAKTVAAALAPAGAPLAPVQAVSLLAAQDVKQVSEQAIIMMTSDESWNEAQPFPTEKRVPQYERPKQDDPDRGTVREPRRGPFPIAIAAEPRVPQSWFESPAAVSPKVRIAVIGHGGIFMGENLKPMSEKLFLDTANWLMGRDALLARDRETWSYPRVELTQTENALWQWGTRLGMPLLFGYLGMVMLLVRRMR